VALAAEIHEGMIELRHQCCMEYMATVPDKAFDLAIVDPPYGIGNWVQISGNVRGEAVTWNDSIPPPEYFAELRRVSSRSVIWGANYYNCFNGGGGALVWNKHMPRESNMSVCELASLSWVKRVDYVDLKWQNINRTEDTIHPCQKPVALYRWLLKNYAKPGQRILDTHLGSGSIAIACDIEGFDLVGCEIDADYIAAARKRLAQHQAQPRLFDAPEKVDPIQLTLNGE
jgi:site-specific DNA-methyltransferase (adenine-specific)